MTVLGWAPLLRWQCRLDGENIVMLRLRFCVMRGPVIPRRPLGNGWLERLDEVAGCWFSLTYFVNNQAASRCGCFIQFIGFILCPNHYAGNKLRSLEYLIGLLFIIEALILQLNSFLQLIGSNELLYNRIYETIVLTMTITSQ